MNNSSVMMIMTTDHQVVAGAHDIKIPWPGSEDSVQKRGVAEMWQVEFF